MGRIIRSVTSYDEVNKRYETALPLGLGPGADDLSRVGWNPADAHPDRRPSRDPSPESHSGRHRYDTSVPPRAAIALNRAVRFSSRAYARDGLNQLRANDTASGCN